MVPFLSRRFAALALVALLAVPAAFQPSTAFARGAMSHAAVCGAAKPGTARCHARIRTDAAAKAARPAPGKHAAAAADVVGNSGAYDPSYLQSAYNLPSSSAGGGQKVAVVDAYDDPTAEADLAAYRSYFGLPACTSASGCLQRLNQSGQPSPQPAADSSWSAEISLDLDMVSAICPNCGIVLIEASSSAYSDLAAGVNAAASLSVAAISNSYGGAELFSERQYDAAYDHPGIAITASAGDGAYTSGYANYPAASPYVIAVGGTTLNQATNGGTRSATETAWASGASGCSAYEPKPAWQKDSGCSMRMVADVAAVADPGTGVWVYDNGTWSIVGGTSVGAPIVAAAYALTSPPAPASPTASLYANSGALNDVSSGANGTCGTYLCTAGPGYDGPTGSGTLNGLSAFTPPAPSIASLSPTSGPTSGGTAVTIGGANLSGASSVTFDGVAASGVNWNAASETLMATAPPGPAGSASVTVTTAGGSASSTFTYVNVAPVVSAISPASGPMTGGTAVTISGSNLSGATAVTFGGASASSFTYNAATGAISAVAPPGAVGAVSVSVTTSGGSSAASAASQFTYTSTFKVAASPSSQAVGAGKRVSFTLVLTALGGYNAPVSLAVSGLPGGGTASFGANPVTPTTSGTTVTLQLRTSPSTARGTYPLTISATGAGAPKRTAALSLVIK